ncbi:MAG: PQQ-like beta-propeller repeat protein [Pirellula sp.]|jgi:outer membrane protein assembly factor BamB|nr:PQQ-like beta-propeller repeat protein [Pirellula sp.]
MHRISFFVVTALSSLSGWVFECPLHAQQSAHGQGDVKWPAFLGAGASSNVADHLPQQWSKEQGIAWKLALTGHGQSSPVVWGDSVYLTTVDGKSKDEFLTYCVDIESGAIRWMNKISNSHPVQNSLYVSRAATTPVVDARGIVCCFESGDCVAYDHAGKQLWKRDLGSELGPIVAEFGLGASPCQTEKLVCMLIEHDGPSYLVALDKGTGDIVWKSERTARRSWSSPATFTIDGVEQIVISSAGTIDGYDAATGKQLWTIEGVGGNTGVTPIDIGKGEFLIGASGGRQGENETAAKKSNGLVRVQKDGELWKASVVWSNEKLAPTWASPIVHRDLAYWVNRVGVVSCVDAATGELVFAERIKQSCWATPIAAGDRIYFFGKDGITSVIAAGREFKVLSENELFDPDQLPPETTQMEEESSEERRRGAAMFGGPTVYGAAAAGDRFLARIGNQLFCIKNDSAQ